MAWVRAGVEVDASPRLACIIAFDLRYAYQRVLVLICADFRVAHGNERALIQIIFIVSEPMREIGGSR